MPFLTRFTSSEGTAVGRLGALAVLDGRLTFADTATRLLFRLPPGAHPALWIWYVEQAFNGTSPQVTVTLSGAVTASIALSGTAVTAAGDKFPFGGAFYPPSGAGWARRVSVSATFSATGTPSAGIGWMRCLYILS